jgi:hypothetical protein
MNRCICIAFVVWCGALSAKADLVVSRNLGPAEYSASGTLGAGFEKELAFDGVAGESGWNAGDFPVQWLEVDLQQPHELTSFQLHVDQNPNGNTVHEIWISDTAMQGNLSGATLAHTFASFTSYQEVLNYTLPGPKTAQFVQVRTTQSPSWVGWLEVEVRAVPEPASALLLILGDAVPARMRRRVASQGPSLNSA